VSCHYYNEFEPYAAQWLRNLIAAGLIPAGEVDERSITDVAADDLAGFRQCHFFAGIGGWALAARLAGWPEDRELWTGSCPCQPFSVAGKGAGADDERHLWPHQLRLLRARRPAVWMGEQVAAAVGKDWLDGVLSDVEGIDYAGRAVVVPACAVNGPHRRDRVWIVAERGVDLADTDRQRPQRAEPAADEFGRRRLADPCRSACGGYVADSAGDGRQQGIAASEAARHGCVATSEGGTGDSGLLADADSITCGQGRSLDRGRDTRGSALARAGSGSGDGGSAWAGAAWIIGHDGKARRVEPGIRLLAHGVPARVGKLRAYGNAIVPAVAAEVIGAFMECRP